MQCCVATVPVGKLHVSRKVSLFYFLLLLLPFPRVIGRLQPAPAQWAGMEPLIWVAKAKKDFLEQLVLVKESGSLHALLNRRPISQRYG